MAKKPRPLKKTKKSTTKKRTIMRHSREGMAAPRKPKRRRDF